VTGHQIRKCKHGRIVDECRCPAADKPVVVVDCPPQCGLDALPPPCNDHDNNELSCAACTAQRRLFYDMLSHLLSRPPDQEGSL
jgi:hypothetical protein